MAEGPDIRVEPSAPERLGELGKTAGKVAASAVLATSLVNVLSEPPRAELITLPEPIPLVQQFEPATEEAIPAEEEADEQQESLWRRIWRVLKWLALAVLLAGTLLFGALKGCATTLGLPAPATEEQEQQQSGAHRTSTEDERGVEVGA